MSERQQSERQHTYRPELVDKAEKALDRRVAPPVTERKYASGAGAHTTDRPALRREQQDEVAQSWFGLGFLTDAQFKGGVAGIVAGAVIGAVLFLPLGLVAWSGLALGWRLAIAALCGALAGSTALAIYLGGREPELEGEMQDVDGRPSIGTTLRDPHSDARGR
jgi:hypothetical protein